MLVPVLVLGLFSCGKVLDAEMMSFDLHGTWEGTGAPADAITIIFAGNEATLKSKSPTSADLQSAAYRVDVNVTTLDKLPARQEGKIKFVGFKDKKQAEIANADFVYEGTGVAGDTITLSNVKRADGAVSYLLPVDGIYTRK